MNDELEIREARRWLRDCCHHGHTRYMLERGLDYLEAVVRAGLCPEATDGQDLYTFLTDPESAAARRHAIVEPEL